MNSINISFNAVTAGDFKPSLPFSTNIDVGQPDDDNHTPWLPEIVKNPPVQLAYVLAHEIRNPLTNINLSIQMLRASLHDEAQKMYFDIIMRSSVKINDLITELLTYQQADIAETEKYSIPQLLEEVLEMAGDRITLKKISVRKDFAKEDCKIIFNRAKIKIALTNIVINAIDAMADENGELKLVTKSMPYGFIVQVEDNGCGISKEHLGNIFKPYFTNKPGGLGLGLASTYDILRANHVKVNVNSVEGEGTQFILLFEKKYPYNHFNK